jgi:hypothetical protein
LIEPTFYTRHELFKATHNQSQLAFHRRLVGQFFCLSLKSGRSFSQVFDSWLELGFLDQAISVTIDQPCQAVSQFTQSSFNSGDPGMRGIRFWLEPPAILLGYPVRMFKEHPYFLPHCQLNQIGAQLMIVADPLAAKTIGVGSNTSIVAVVAPLTFAAFLLISFPEKA